MSKTINETLDFGSIARIRHLPAASNSDEPVRKAEFDSMQAGLVFIEKPVVAVVTSNVNTASPGATFDGVAPVSGDTTYGRLLLTGQTTTSQNGIYIWNGATSALTRSGDTYLPGTVVVVGPDGSTNAKTLWLQTTDNPVVGTTALTFTQFGTTLSAGTGLTLSGTVISLTTPVSVGNGGTGSSSASGARSNLGAAGTYSATFGDGSSTTFTINHNLANRYCVVVVTNLSTNQDEDCTVTRNSANQLTLSSEAWTATPPGSSAYEVSCIG